MTPLPLTGRVALVTGGAGGIGSAICRAFAEAGASVIIVYRSSETQAQELLESLAGEGHTALQAAVDDSAALTALAAEVEARYGRLDTLVNNAGLTRPVPHDDLDALDDTLIDEIFRVNWRGAFAAIRAFKPLLSRSSDGLVVNISSIAGRSGQGSNVAYCASKAALDSLTRSLGRALAPEIRVLSVSPGWVMGDYARRMDAGMLETQRARTPLGRLGEAEDVAQAVLALATHLKFSTGCIIPVDGGRPLT